MLIRSMIPAIHKLVSACFYPHHWIHAVSTVLYGSSIRMDSEVQQPGADSTELLSAAVARIMSEAQDWQRIMSVDAEVSLTVYLDMKSPYAAQFKPQIRIAIPIGRMK